MYLLRGAIISLGSFFVVYCLASALVALGWRLARRKDGGSDPHALFLLRVLPLIAGIAAVAALVIPSFALLEPLDPLEGMALRGSVAALAGMGVLLFGAANGLRGWWVTRRKLAPLVRDSRRIGDSAAVPVLEFGGEEPTCMVVGILRPTLMVSRNVRDLLAQGEMSAALRHELAHVRRRDNLKKLAMRFCAFPGMAGLEREWLRAAEMAADDEASRDELSALELAAALVKMARSATPGPAPELAMRLLPETDAPLALRIARLLAWSDRPAKKGSRLRLLLPAATVAALVCVQYLPLLTLVHEMTEFLVR